MSANALFLVICCAVLSMVGSLAALADNWSIAGAAAIGFLGYIAMILTGLFVRAAEARDEH